MTPEQVLLISLLLGRALDAILVNVQKMTPLEVAQALEAEEAKTEDLLGEMRSIT